MISKGVVLKFVFLVLSIGSIILAIIVLIYIPKVNANWDQINLDNSNNTFTNIVLFIMILFTVIAFFVIYFDYFYKEKYALKIPHFHRLNFDQKLSKIN